MIDSRTFLSIFSRFQIALLFIMGFLGLWNNWTVYYNTNFSSVIGQMVVLTLFYVYISNNNSDDFSKFYDKQKYINYVGFGFIFFILLSFYFELAGTLTNAMVVYLVVLFVAFLYSRLCYNKWIAIIIKLLLILFLFYLTPKNMINESLIFSKIDITNLYKNSKTITATASQYEYHAIKRPTQYIVAFNGDFKITNCRYIFKLNYYCQVKNFDKIIGNVVTIKISNDKNNSLLAVYDVNGNEIYNFYNHYKNRQKSEYIWAWFYRVEYYIFLLFLILLPLPKQSDDEKELFDDDSD